MSDDLLKQKLRPTSRIFWSPYPGKWMTYSWLHCETEKFGRKPHDVIIFSDNYFFRIGGDGQNFLLAEKSAILLIQGPCRLPLSVNSQNILLSVTHALEDKRRISIAEEVWLEYGQTCIVLTGPINEVYRDCVALQKLLEVKNTIYSKTNYVFRKYTSLFEKVKEKKHDVEIEKFFLRKQVLTDIWFAMCSMELPDYVMLEIVDWLELLFYDDHREKIALIQGLSRSRRKIKGIER